MRDTPESVEQQVRELTLQRSGEDRVLMGCSMHATAQALVRSSVLARNPQASEADVRRELFLRFYGRDFDAGSRAQILVALGESQEAVSSALDELLEQMTTWPYGMPVRAMERVLAMGAAAIPRLANALDHCREDEERDPLWLIVLLGEMRHPDGVSPLIEQMRRPDLDILAQAAVEGLAKIGPPAVPALIDAARADDPAQRLYAYAGLGWIRDERAYAALLDALGHDPALGDVIATALVDQGRPKAIPAVDQAYRQCEPWQRADFEEALRALHRGDEPDRLWTTDWRLRYRRVPALGDSIDPEWVGVSSILRRQDDLRRGRAQLPLRSLEEILAEPSEPDEPPETCEDCGAPIFAATGIPACPETAVAVAVYQLRLLNDAREDGIEDLFELLDELEADESEHRDRGEPRTPAARQRWRDEVHELVMARQTCRWLIEQGIEEVGQGKALLLARAARLADEHGDPEGLLRPATRPRLERHPKVGRNDPCPCGSGRKYKRCCLSKA